MGWRPAGWRCRTALAVALAGGWPPATAAAAQLPGAAAHLEAQRLLESGDGKAAVGPAFTAIEASNEFAAEDWFDEAPEGNIVLDEATAAAASFYRRQRAAYRLTLGDALLAAGDASGAEVEYRRSAALRPDAAIWNRLAEVPGLPLPDRVEFLLRAWSWSGSGERGSVLERLRASGAFRTADGLAAALDRFRFREPGALGPGAPEGLAPEADRFPDLSLAVAGGAWSSARAFAEDRRIVLYTPGPGCPRCGEVVDDLQLALRDRAVDLIVAVGDAELDILLRIAGLTGAGLFRPEPRTASGRSRVAPRPVGHAVRRATVAFPPAEATGDEEMLWVAARSGLSVWRIPLGGAVSVRRALTALFRFLNESPVSAGQEDMVAIPADPEPLLEILRRLEAGPESLVDLDARLTAAVRTELRTHSVPERVALRLLRRAAGLQVGDEARLLLLNAWAPRFGERMLEAAQAVDGGVTRAVRGGRLRVAASEGEDALAIARDYEREDGEPVVFFARASPDGALRGLGVVPGAAVRVVARPEGFVFVRTGEADDGEPGECAVWAVSGEPGLTERCGVEVRDNAVVVRRSQLVAAPHAEGALGVNEAPPSYWRRVDGGAGPAAVEVLNEGLDAFAAGEVVAAEAAFRRVQARIGPGSVVSGAAVRFNLAMAAEARGDREEALAILLRIGDGAFPGALAEARRRLYGASP